MKNSNFKAIEPEQIAWAVFDEGSHGCLGKGLIGIFESEPKAKEAIGTDWLIIKPVPINKLFKNGIK